MTEKKTVAVIGAGIAGITVAYELAKQGWAVTVWEKSRYPAWQTSRANGSQLSVCNSQTWTTWSMIAKGLSQTLQPKAPFRLSLNPFDLEKWRWLAKFFLTTAQGKYAENTRKTIALALQSRVATLETALEENIQFDHVQQGILHVYTREKTWQQACEVESLMTGAGCEWTLIDPRSCRVIEPALQNFNLCGGVYTQQDSSGDMRKFCVALAEVCEQKLDTRFVYSAPVNSITPGQNGVLVNGEFFHECVIAAGVDSQRWATKFRDAADVYPVKGYSITVNLSDSTSQAAAPWTSLLDEDAKIVASRLGQDRLRIAGTAEIAGYDLTIEPHRIAPLLDWCQTWFPQVNTQDFQPWCGLRPMTPSMLPFVQASRESHIWYHTGHGHLGWTLSSGTARILARQIENASQ